MPAKDIGLVEPNDSTILPRIDRGEYLGKGIKTFEWLGLVKSRNSALLHHQHQVTIERRDANVLIVIRKIPRASMAHHKHANKQGKRHQGDKDKRGGPHLYHDRRLALVNRSLVALFLGLAGDRTHIERRIIGAVAPCFAHVNNLVRIE